LKRKVRSIVGLVAAGVSLWLAFSGVDLRSLAGAFRVADPLWLAVASLSVFLTLTFVVSRLRLLATAWSDAPSFRLLWHLTIIGQVANIVIPFRIGDGVKIASGSRGLGLPPVVVGAMVAVERLLDALILVIAAGLLVLFHKAPGWTAPVLTAASTVGFAVVAAGLVAAQWIARSEAMTPRRLRRTRLYGFVAHQLDLVRRGVAAVSAPVVGLRLVLGTMAIVLGSALTNLLTMRAFDLAVPAVVALLLVVLVQSGTALAGAPGGVGVSQFVAVETLGLWDVPPATALAYSLALFVLVRAPKILMLPSAIAAISGTRHVPEVSVK
jgi:uncharacterized membrane protein YbhN (UPF0104 family)